MYSFGRNPQAPGPPWSAFSCAAVLWLKGHFPEPLGVEALAGRGDEPVGVPPALLVRDGAEATARPEAAALAKGPVVDARRGAERGRCRVPGQVGKPVSVRPGVSAAFRHPARRRRRRARLRGSAGKVVLTSASCPSALSYLLRSATPPRAPHFRKFASVTSTQGIRRHLRTLR